MRCNECGGEIVNGVCQNCGLAVGDSTQKIEMPSAAQQTGGAYQDPNAYAQRPAPGPNPYSSSLNYTQTNEPVSIARWIGRMFVKWIPFVGGLVYIIMLIIWACSDRFEKTSKNWAIASIVMAAINIMVSILVVWMISAFIGALLSDPSVQNDINNFMQTIPQY